MELAGKYKFGAEYKTFLLPFTLPSKRVMGQPILQRIALFGFEGAPKSVGALMKAVRRPTIGELEGVLRSTA
jgi:hypothetical protein